eukprot:contig_26668_g6560
MSAAAVPAETPDVAGVPVAAPAEAATVEVDAAPAAGPAADSSSATPYTCLVVWEETAWVLCAPCDTTIMDATQLKHHLSTQSHKSAVRKVVDASPEAENGAPAPVDASASVDRCRALLSAPTTPAQEVLRNRYLASAWPASVTAAHLPRVPILSVRADSAVCYQCSTVAPTAK